MDAKCLFVFVSLLLLSSLHFDTANAQDRWILVSPTQDDAMYLSDGPKAHPMPDANAVMWCLPDSAIYLLAAKDRALWRHENDNDRWIRLDRLPVELDLREGLAAWTRSNPEEFWLLDASGHVWSYARETRQWRRHEPLNQDIRPRVRFAEVWYDDNVDQLYVYGGGNSTTTSRRQLWTLHYDTMNWTRLRDGPESLDGGTVAHSTGSTVAYLWGSSGALYRLDFETQEWELLKLGGQAPTNVNVMWISTLQDKEGNPWLMAMDTEDGVWRMSLVDEKEWEKPKRTSSRQAAPRDRMGVAMCQQAQDGLVFVWGGRNADDTKRWNDLWSYGSKASFIKEGWETWKSDQTFAAASLSAAMSTICFFMFFCYALYHLIRCIKTRKKIFDYKAHVEDMGY